MAFSSEAGPNGKAAITSNGISADDFEDGEIDDGDDSVMHEVEPAKAKVSAKFQIAAFFESKASLVVILKILLDS